MNKTQLENACKDEHFANGRLARNIYDDLVMNHARRVVSIANPTDEDLSRLIDKDFKINKYKNSAQKPDPRKPKNDPDCSPKK